MKHLGIKNKETLQTVISNSIRNIDSRNIKFANLTNHGANNGKNASKKMLKAQKMGRKEDCSIYDSNLYKTFQDWSK